MSADNGQCTQVRPTPTGWADCTKPLHHASPCLLQAVTQ